MTSPKGTLALMGSGELTSTMVQVHKDLLAVSSPSPRAVFLDTPAGFELNADLISRRAVEYFNKRVLHDLAVASFKSRDSVSEYDAARAFRLLEQATYILIGPGSPTYALRQWRGTPVRELFLDRIRTGGCLTAASAAALTVGAKTVPVYELYKVGEEPFWAEGLDLLGALGFSLAVIPHWNNAEGGTFDTRFCFMGEPRFRTLEGLLPDGTGVLGIDEHTACILDFGADEARVRGIGTVTLRRNGRETVFRKGDRVPLRVLREESPEGAPRHGEDPGSPALSPPEVPDSPDGGSLWDRLHHLQGEFQLGLEQQDAKGATNALLELDRSVWQAHQDMESPEAISQARDLFRELIVQFGMQLESACLDPRERLAPLIRELLAERDARREQGKFGEADALRDLMLRAGVVVEDTGEGVRWRLKES